MLIGFLYVAFRYLLIYKNRNYHVWTVEQLNLAPPSIHHVSTTSLHDSQHMIQAL